jgi:hypothetical protein
MPARLRSIPDQLWTRLAALDARCDFLLERRSTSIERVGQGGKLYQREWRVTIADRLNLGRGPLVCIHSTLALALDGAVQMAEDSGWANPPA